MRLKPCAGAMTISTIFHLNHTSGYIWMTGLRNYNKNSHNHTLKIQLRVDLNHQMEQTSAQINVLQ